MKLSTVLSLALLVGVMFTGCVSVRDQSEKYHDIIGKRYATRYDAYLWKMVPHQYGLVPYKLKSKEMDYGPYGTRVSLIPAGTVVTVKDAKVSLVGGDWDYILAELEVPSTKQRIVFEEMLGFSNVAPSEINKRWIPLP